MTDTENSARSNWFVGASHGGNGDQTSRFLSEGIWENGYDDKPVDLVRSMQPGERIAIKSAYARKRGIPFDNRGNAVAVMAIKAIGTITENLDDGKRVRVDWTNQEPPREWYFYTNRVPVWRVRPGKNWRADGLLAFAFEGMPQDIDRFRNAPFWRERFGPNTEKDTTGGGDHMSDDLDEGGDQEAIETAPPLEPYSIDDVLKDGCFLSRAEIERLLERLRSKKNLILQGPPGTGKTWLAKRLAFALMGERDDGGIRAVQFHPNLSYEDFVRGWRPTGEGKLALADGVFMEAIHAASRNPSLKSVVVIEEINRGNPARIFGELLTLLEAGKRTPGEALELCYPNADGTRRPVHVPENLHIIGTMNIADRSLALVDLAFRRRFAFITLEPKFGDVWRNWVVDEGGIDPELAPEIERRIVNLNEKIAGDLGNQFRIGHSYVTPTHRLETGSTRDWFLQVAETEIGPLLEEYWFDAPKTAKDALDRLIEGW